VVSRFNQIVTGRASLRKIISVRQDNNIVSLKASQTYGITLEFSIPEIKTSFESLRNSASQGATGRGTIIAFCDWGCDFAHANLRDKQGKTRLLYLWDNGVVSIRKVRTVRLRARVQPRSDQRALMDPDPYASLAYDPSDADPGGTGTHATHVIDKQPVAALLPDRHPE